MKATHKKDLKPTTFTWFIVLQHPVYYLKNLLMTFHLDSHATTKSKLEMSSGVKTGNRIPYAAKMYAALHMCKHIEKTTFLCKND